jgi:hypothetical protein
MASVLEVAGQSAHAPSLVRAKRRPTITGKTVIVRKTSYRINQRAND